MSKVHRSALVAITYNAFTQWQVGRG